MIKYLYAICSIFLFCLYCFPSCSSDENNNYSHQLKEAEVINFPIDTNTDCSSTYIAYHSEKNIPYLLIENRTFNSIQFYNMNTKKLAKRVRFERQGEHGLGDKGMGGFWVDNMNEIYVNAMKKGEICVSDTTAKIHRRVNTSPNDDLYYSISGVTKVPLYKRNQKMYAFILADFSIFTEPANGHPLELEIDLEKGQSEIIFRFPDIYEGFYGMYNTHPCRTGYKDKLVYSFPISPDIYVLDINTKEVNQYAVPSEFMNKEFVPIKEPSHEKMKQYAMENGQYFEIVYDKWRDVFYRFILHPTSYIDPSTGEPKTTVQGQKPFSVQIISPKFEKLGEVAFPADIYYQRDFFVGPEGLYISNYNFKNPHLQEDAFTFTLFTLEKTS